MKILAILIIFLVSLLHINGFKIKLRRIKKEVRTNLEYVTCTTHPPSKPNLVGAMVYNVSKIIPNLYARFILKSQLPNRVLFDETFNVCRYMSVRSGNLIINLIIRYYQKNFDNKNFNFKCPIPKGVYIIKERESFGYDGFLLPDMFKKIVMKSIVVEIILFTKIRGEVVEVSWSEEILITLDDEV